MSVDGDRGVRAVCAGSRTARVTGSAALALCLLAIAWLLTFAGGPWGDERVSDLPLYRSVANAIREGLLPYRDLPFEYPPLAAAVVALPGMAGRGEEAYRLAFGALMLATAVGVLLLTGFLAARTRGDARRAMLAVAAAPLLCGAMIRTHFDLAPVALTLGALALLCAGRTRIGLGTLGLAVMTKGFPLVVAPVAIAWLRGRAGRRAALRGTLALALVIAAVSSAAAAVSPAGAADAVRFQGERPVQLESSPALVLLALDGLGLGEARIRPSHGSHAVLHPAGDAVTALFGAALVGALVFLTVAAAVRPRSERQLVLASLSAVAAFAALGKVLSPQFLIWLIPLAALAIAWRMRALALATAAAIALTLVEFPSRYWDLVAREPFPLVVVALRDVAIVAALAAAMRAVAALRGFRARSGVGLVGGSAVSPRHRVAAEHQSAGKRS